MGKNENLVFASATTQIVMTFTIENLAEDRSITYSLTDNCKESKNVTKFVSSSTDFLI